MLSAESLASIPAAVLEVVTALQKAGFDTYLVGGCVRDMARGQVPKDFDVATQATPADVQKTFRKVIPTGIQHGTVTVLARGHHVEVTTFRAEGPYVDGRRPSHVAFHSDIEHDLARRDFTINAMAFDPSRQRLVDPFKGQDDLAAHRIRCVGSALERFAEDGLRPLRAVRFAAMTGFALDPDTEAAIGQRLDVFRKVSPERVHDELVKILLSKRPRLGLIMLARTGLLADISKDLAQLDATTFDHVLGTVERVHETLELRLAALLFPLDTPRAQAFLEGLRFPTRTIENAMRLMRHLHLEPHSKASDAQLRRWLADLGPPHVPALFLLAGARQNIPASVLEPLHARVKAVLDAKPPLTSKDLALDGRAIMRTLGIAPGPEVGRATRHLMDLVFDDPARNTVAALTEALQAWKAAIPGA